MDLILWQNTEKQMSRISDGNRNIVIRQRPEQATKVADEICSGRSRKLTSERSQANAGRPKGGGCGCFSIVFIYF